MYIYDYEEAIVDDIENVVFNDLGYSLKDLVAMIDDKGIDEVFNDLYNDLWTDDNVTGNGSGSYTFSEYEAMQHLVGNWGLLCDAINEFNGSCEIDISDYAPEKMDVAIRCYLLDEYLRKFLEDVKAGFYLD